MYRDTQTPSGVTSNGHPLSTELLEWALKYAGFGWPVLPLWPKSKAPLTEHGVLDASTEIAVIGRWWQRWPDANIGIATGAPGPTVVDIDDMAAAGKDVIARLQALGAPEVATPRGRHFYFAGTTDGTVKLGYGEIRGRGSYVVAPPSQHPDGPYYPWIG
jgi:hypothetical protein